MLPVCPVFSVDRVQWSDLWKRDYFLQGQWFLSFDVAGTMKRASMTEAKGRET